MHSTQRNRNVKADLLVAAKDAWAKCKDEAQHAEFEKIIWAISKRRAERSNRRRRAR